MATTSVDDVISTSNTTLNLITSSTLSLKPETISLNVYAIAIPILVWIFAVVIFYPITFVLYRYCLRIRPGRKRRTASQRRRHGNANPAQYHYCFCCCVTVADSETGTNDSSSVDTVSRSVSVSMWSSRGLDAGVQTVWSPETAVGLPPSYDAALSMPKPRVGDAVRFQNNADGGWCTFTYVGSDAVDCTPPTYDAFVLDSRFISALGHVTAPVNNDDVITATLDVTRTSSNEAPPQAADYNPPLSTDDVIIDVSRL